ncbi:hypothetical protein AWB91_14530 [Mycobacterium paraense]|uniref:Uncharacterized protein n=1 Tax=Mycobacterium paraense TaxID=767916 RepID=A0A1X2ADA3_9MYCO|nr:hypothetical protein AWB91_14530 [Mycobacterium paraense]ORW42703.1 hypothetical protein AWB88_08090 [Mycobacterium paraense]ORW48674.1 hypothetical protein AWB90_10525 [Mycobacterium paraense]
MALPGRSRLSQFFFGATLDQQYNEIAQGASVEPLVGLLDYRRDVRVRKLRILSGKTTLNRLDLCPLFFRPARKPIH